MSDDEVDRDKSDNDDKRSGDDDEEDIEKADGDEKEKEVEEPIPERRIAVEIPKISVDLGSDLHFVKLPNFLSVETRPYDRETYEDEIDEEETLDEEGRARYTYENFYYFYFIFFLNFILLYYFRVKLKVENTIRWREVFDRDGNVIKESNTRVIKWSDGSMSLHLGSEIFDVYKQPLVVNNCYFYLYFP